MMCRRLRLCLLADLMQGSSLRKVKPGFLPTIPADQTVIILVKLHKVTTLFLQPVDGINNDFTHIDSKRKLLYYSELPSPVTLMLFHVFGSSHGLKQSPHEDILAYFNNMLIAF